MRMFNFKPQPVWAIAESGGIPMDDGGDDDDLGLDFHDEDGQDDDSELDGEITGDENDAFKALFEKPEGAKDDDDDSGDSDDEDTPEALAAEQAALVEAMETAISGFQITEDMIPDDFNPSDPKQFREVVGSINQAAIRQSIGIMFRPVQATLTRMQRGIDKQLDAAISSSASSRDFETQLLATIPAAGDEHLRPGIEPYLAQARKRFPNNVPAQLKAVKNAMVAMGMNPMGRKPKSQASKVTSVLDLYAPKPAAPTRRTQQQLSRQRGGK